MSSGKPKDGDLQIVPAAADNPRPPAVPPRPLMMATSAGSNAIVEYTGPVFKEQEEDLELKLRRILENVPVRVSNTSGSSAGAGSGDFHQYRQMRRREQDRVARMEVDYLRRKEEAEFRMRREERLKAEEEQGAKKRAKRQKKKQKKKERRKTLQGPAEGAAGRQKQESSDDGSESEDESTK